MSFIFFVGGSHSGKSRLAQAWAEAAAPDRVLLATCHAKDKDGAKNNKDKTMRNGWICLEEPLEPLGAFDAWRKSQPDFNGSIALDSLGMWIANLMSQNLPISAINRRISTLAEALATPEYSCAVVSEEYGLGFVPANSIARKFGDILGFANQTMAKYAHAVILVSCGLPFALKGTIPAVLSRFVEN